MFTRTVFPEFPAFRLPLAAITVSPVLFCSTYPLSSQKYQRYSDFCSCCSQPLVHGERINIRARAGAYTTSRPSAAIRMAVSAPQPENAIDFLTLLHNLKETKRTGWVRKGIKGPESIADHMYRMSMMGLICGADTETQVRCIKLAIVHDVAEAIVGDITPHDGVSDKEKYRLENGAIEKIRQTIGSDLLAGEEIEKLWQEYEHGQSPAAQLVKDFDKLEMILQAQEYEARQEVRLDEFFASTDGKWRTDLGRAWAREIVSRRNFQ